MTKSIRYYDSHALELSAQYNAVSPGELHGRWFANMAEKAPGIACDIGAGSGRDANWLASQGWDVVAVEPSAAMRERAQASNHPGVTWLDDALPDLRALRSLGHRFEEPAILREWSSLTHRWGISDYRSTDMGVFDWEEGRRDTSLAIGRAVALKSKGVDVPCVWTAVNPRATHIDHCFPWARWLNNDLWNLLPATADANLSKGDKLPSAPLMAEARSRILRWWQYAYVQSALKEQFFLEAGSSLPGLAPGETALADIYNSLLHQRARLKADQQLVEWLGYAGTGKQA